MDSNITTQTSQKTIKKNSLFSEFFSILKVIILALSIRIFIFEPFHIPSESMIQNFIIGDYVFSTKYDYGYSKFSIPFDIDFLKNSNQRFFKSEPKRGDVIIFRPPHRMNDRFIKRLIGLPGDKIAMKNGVIYVNDKEFSKKIIKEYTHRDLRYYQYEETNIDGKKYKVQYFTPETKSQFNNLINERLYQANNWGPVIVPNDQYFFMGDNRDDSGDSRYELGTVPSVNLISKVRYIFFSFERNLFNEDETILESLANIGSWISSFRFNRFLQKIDK